MSMVPQESHDQPPADPPFQFALRTLLLYVGAICVLLAMAVRLGTVWGMVLIWAVMLVAAHVFGN